MKEIMLRKYIEGEGNMAISYDDGKKCQKYIVEYLDQGEKVALNFSGIDYVITAFLNPIIGDLILERGDSVMKDIGIINANEAAIS